MSAFEENIKALTGIANADLATPYRFIKMINDGGVAEVGYCAAGETADGILLDTGLSGQAVRYADIRGGGRCPLEYGGSITAGGEISASTSGVGIAQSSTNDAFAKAIFTGSSGEIHAVQLSYFYH